MKKFMFLTGIIMLAVFTCPKRAGAQELLANRTFESGTSPWFLDNWAGNTASASRTVDTPRAGSYCQRIKLTAVTSGAPASVYFSYQHLNVLPGMPILVKCWLRGKENGTLEILLRQGTSSGAVYYRHRFKLRASWQEYSFRTTMPANIDTSNTQLSFQLTEVGYFAVDDISVTNTNLATNPGFETGTSPWQFTSAPVGAASYLRDSTDKHYGNYSTRLQLSSAGTATYTYPNIQVKPTMPVKVDFWARGATNGTQVNLLLRKGTAPYTVYYQTAFTAGTSWQPYSCMTMLPDSLASNVQLYYQLNNTDTLLLDDVAVYDNNMVTNPGFESATTPWIYDNWDSNIGSSVRDTVNPHSGNYGMRVNLTQVINTPSLIYTYPRLPLKPGMPVQLRFWARGLSNSPAITVFIRQGTSPYTSYLRNELNLTDEWQEYSFIGVMPATIDTTNVLLSFQISNTGFFVLDDVSVTPMPEKETGDPITVNPVRNPSFEVGRDGWSGTIRVREFGSQELESGSHIPSPENAALSIQTEVGAPDQKRFMRVQVNNNSWAYITSAYFKARYGQPVTLSCWIRSDSARPFAIGYGRGKNKAYSAQAATKTAATTWKKFTQKYTLPPSEGGLYTFIIKFDQPGRFDIDAVAVTEDVVATPVLFTKAVAIEPAAGAPVAHLYNLNDAASFRLVTAGETPSATIPYAVTVFDYTEANIYSGTVTAVTDATGAADTAFTVPTTVYGGFRIEVRKQDSTDLLAEQLYSVLPALPDPATRPNSFFGGHADFTTYNLSIAKRAGFRWLRTWGPLMTTWMAAEQTPGVWNFPTQAIARADSMGFQLFGMLGTAPAFRADTLAGDINRWSYSYPPKNIGDWKQYIINCYNAYNSYINAWEVWNEPDGKYLVVKPGQSKPAIYYSLLQAARQVFDSMNITKPLIGPAVANINDSLGWQVLNMGGNSKMDAFSFHLYNVSSGGASPDVNYITPVLNNLHSYLNKSNDSMPLWHSEGGPYLSGGRSWLATYNVTPSSSVTLPQAAAVMVRTALYLKASGVKRYFDFTLNASPTGRRIDVDMIAPYVDVTGIPTPALAAHAAMVSITEDADPVGFYVLPGSNGVKQARFQDSSDRFIDVYWSNTPVWLKDVAGLGANDEIKDLMGNPVDSNSARIGEFPLYVIRGNMALRSSKAAAPVKSEMQISIRPNPVNTTAILSHPVLPYQSTAYIINAGGQVLRAIAIQPGTGTTVVDVARLPQGIYFLQYNGRIRQTLKLVH